MPEADEQTIVRRLIEVHREALEEEFGTFTLVDSPTFNRVVLIPDNATDREGWAVCYRSDSTVDARLLIDDYVPEVAE